MDMSSMPSSKEEKHFALSKVDEGTALCISFSSHRTLDTAHPAYKCRILYDVPCAVCRDHSSGKHYGVYACDGCAGFFKRSVRRQRSYACKARLPGRCLVDKTHRNQCRSCRMDKCLDVGMNRDAVQHERGPRNSTIRRQMALYMGDSSPPTNLRFPIQQVHDILPKRPLVPPPPPLNLFYPFLYPGMDMTSSAVPLPRTIPSPSVIPGMHVTKDPGETCESAAKLLFMNVKWAKGIPAFENLSIEDRHYLLGETWKDLFVIGAAQFLYPMDLKILVKKNASIDVKDVELFEGAMAEIATLRPYSMEFTCLRGIMLFKVASTDKIDDSRKIQDQLKVLAENERNKNILGEYVALTHPSELYRATQLLDLLPIISRVPGDVIVDLFFRATVGDIPIERIICDMYKTA